MPSFSIAVDLAHLLPPQARLTAEAFPNLAAAVQRLTALAHQEWTEYALGKALPSGMVIHSRTGEYARSILFKETGPFSAEVYSELPYAKYIEEGTPSYDMKRMLSSSWKVRLTKSGKRFLVIPFRHDKYNTHADVLDWWSGKQTSHVTGSYRRTSGAHGSDIRTRQLVTVPGWRYAWGDRLGKRDLAGMGIQGSAAKRLEGMVKFANPGGKAGGGAPKGSHSQLITFRKMIEGSKGWIARAQPGKYPARTVAQSLQPLAEELFAAAVEADVRHLLGSE